MPTPSPSQPAPPQSPSQRALIVAASVLVLLFSLPLFNLVRFAVTSTLYSHIVLIPFVSGYLVWLRWPLKPDSTPPNRLLAVTLFAFGAAVLAIWSVLLLTGNTLAREDSLALTTLSFLGFFAGLCSWHLGRQSLYTLRFPLIFLVFMVPMPAILESWIETVLQHGSAAVAHGLFSIAGTVVYVDGLTFQLPGITLHVAPECSGIHSSLALFITSIVAGSFFLRSPVRRTVLALAVFPLALLRNGFRVFVLGELCVRVSPDMINSYIHHRGGPIFFVLSLIPFSLFLLLLIRSERKARPKS